MPQSINQTLCLMWLSPRYGCYKGEWLLRQVCTALPGCSSTSMVHTHLFAFMWTSVLTSEVQQHHHEIMDGQAFL